MSVTILNYMSFLSKNMTYKFINSKSCRKRNDMVPAAIFCLASLKVKYTTDTMLSDRLDLSTPKLCKNKRKKSALKCRSKFNVSYLSLGYIQTFSKTGYNILSFKTIYVMGSGPIVRWPISPTAHWSDGPLVRRTTDWSDGPLVRRPIGPTAH